VDAENSTYTVDATKFIATNPAVFHNLQIVVADLNNEAVAFFKDIAHKAIKNTTGKPTPVSKSLSGVEQPRCSPAKMAKITMVFKFL
jgi:hypothetical protein